MIDSLQNRLGLAALILAISLGIGSCNYFTTISDARLIEAKAARTTAESAAKRSAPDVR